MQIKEVSKIEVKDKPWNCNGKDMWNVAITFSDGTRGHANATSPTPPYGTGDFVEMTETGETPWGEPKVKVKKTDAGAPGAPQAESTIPQTAQSPSVGSQTPSRGNEDDRVLGQIAGWALHMATICKGKPDEDLAWDYIKASENVVKRLKGGHPELEKSNRGPQPAYPESEGGMPDGSECPF